MAMHVACVYNLDLQASALVVANYYTLRIL